MCLRSFFTNRIVMCYMSFIISFIFSCCKININSGITKVRTNPGELKNCGPVIFKKNFTARNESITVAALASSDRKKTYFEVEDTQKFKYCIASELNKFQMRKAKLIAQFGKYGQKRAAIFLTVLCDCITKRRGLWGQSSRRLRHLGTEGKGICRWETFRYFLLKMLNFSVNIYLWL